MRRARTAGRCIWAVGVAAGLFGACADDDAARAPRNAQPTPAVGPRVHAVQTSTAPTAPAGAPEPPSFALDGVRVGEADALAATQRDRRFEGIEARAMRRELLYLAATSRTPDIVDAALRALGDDDVDAFAPDERVALRDAVLKHLVNPDLAGFAAHAAHGVHAIDATGAVQAELVRVLATHRRPGVRAEAARALVRAPQLNADAILALTKAGLDPFPGVRLAVAGDGTYGDRGAVLGALWAAMAVLLDYHHEAVRSAAARSVGVALGRGDLEPVRRAEVAAALRAKLEDRWGRVRCAALDGLGASGDRAFVHDAIAHIADGATCTEQPAYPAQSPDGTFVDYDGTARAYPPGPVGTVAQATFRAVAALMGDDLPAALRERWTSTDVKGPASPAALARAMRQWYAKARRTLPPQDEAALERLGNPPR